MTITNSSTRLAALVAGVAVALALMGAVAVAPAQAAGLTSTQVQAIVSLLASFGADQATINNVTAALNGQSTTGTGSTSGNGGVCPVLTRSLQLGSSGSDVMSLQQFLNGTAATRVSVSGAGSPGMETTYFGPATQSAVVKFQAANNVSAIGVVGPATRAAIAAVCGTVVNPGNGNTDTGGALKGGEGELNDIDNTSSDVEDQVRENEEENIYGLEMTAEDSDMMIERVDVDFTRSDVGSGSKHLDDYIDSVSLMLDGKELASMDVDEADQNDADETIFDSNANAEDNDVYEFRFSGLKGIIREDDTARLYVVAHAVNNVDTSDTNKKSWFVNIPTDGVRAVDAAGISDTYVSNTESTSEQFTVGEAEAGDVDLSANSGDNEDRVITVDADNDTNDEEIMAFSLESQTSDNNVSEIRVHLATSTATTTQFSEVISQLHLMQGSKEIATADVDDNNTTGAVAIFDDLDIDIDEDDEVEFTVTADFNDEADKRNGFTFAPSIVGSEVDVEDAEGDDVTVGGTVTGGDLELRTSGITAAFKSADDVRTNGSNAGDADSVDFTIKFSVTAVGDDDLWIDGDALEVVTGTALAGNNGLQWATSTDSSVTATTTATAILTADDGYQTGDDSSASGNKYFKIENGETRNFTFRVNLSAGTDGQSLGARIIGLKWGTANNALTNLYTFDMANWTTDTVTGLNIR